MLYKILRYKVYFTKTKKMKKYNLIFALIILSFTACKLDKSSGENAIKRVEIGAMPNWGKNATIYEVNLRQYSADGQVSTFATHLPRLKEMGVDILWFMPIRFFII